MEKTTPSFPTMCFGSQKYFYSNIHLFTTCLLRGICFLFGVFFNLPEGCFSKCLGPFGAPLHTGLVNSVWNHWKNNILKAGVCTTGHPEAGGRRAGRRLGGDLAGPPPGPSPGERLWFKLLSGDTTQGWGVLQGLGPPNQSCWTGQSAPLLSLGATGQGVLPYSPWPCWG